MARFAFTAALLVGLFLSVPAQAVDTGGGGGNGGGNGGGQAMPSPSAKPAKSSSTADRTPFTPLDQARGAVRERRYEVAVRRLQRIVAAEPGNADAWNLLGFSYRMLGQLDQSSSAYLKVLAIDPNHTGALEYQGELFITQGNLKGAKANLARLRELCGSCEEAEDLAQALQSAGA